MFEIRGYKCVGSTYGININDYDLVVKSIRKSYTSETYKIVKNTTNLTDEEIARVCDYCNFGYHRDNDYQITVYTD